MNELNKHLKNNQVSVLLSKIEKMDGITEVMLNGPKNIFIEQQGRIIYLDDAVSEKSYLEYIKLIAKYNKKDFSKSVPILDGSLPDGSRINIIGGELTDRYPVLTIRKYLESFDSLENSYEKFCLDKKWLNYFKSIIQSRLNLIIYGGTGAGKTTFLNLLLNEINPTERIVVIEDTRELVCRNPNVVYLKSLTDTAPSFFSGLRPLVKNSLRMRPDRIIVGEVRSAEAFDLIMAMNTGHSGSMTSIHANTTKDVIHRLSNLILLNGIDFPGETVARQISSAINIVIGLQKGMNGRNHIRDISEFVGMESGNVSINQIAKFDGEKLVPGKSSSYYLKRLVEVGLAPNFFKSQS
ncbi:ATPase, T2SS/T4P/T4SS family [Bacteriovoracaceae bacterium]|nr:ATPase, T2SS/T4P/T4SS family [Bacteriovoracaceae bacterium]